MEGIRMRTSTLALVAASLLGLAPIGMAQAQVRLSVMGGIAAPMSSLGDVADLGYHVAAGLNFRGGPLPIGVRAEGSFSSFGL